MGGRGGYSGIVHRVPNYKNATIADTKITKYCLDPSKKHFKEFTDVGYSKDDPERLKIDLLKGLSENEAEGTFPNEHGARSFVVKMDLGVTKKKKFKTVWQIDKDAVNPKFVTAHRLPMKGRQ